MSDRDVAADPLAVAHTELPADAVAAAPFELSGDGGDEARVERQSQVSRIGYAVRASRQSAAWIATPTAPVKSEYRCVAWLSAWTAKRRARSSHSSSPVRSNALRSA